MTCLKQGIKAVKLTSVMRAFPDEGGTVPPCHVKILNVFDEEGTAPSPHHIENTTWTTAPRILVGCVLCPSLWERTHVWLSSMPQWCLIYQINYITYIFYWIKGFSCKSRGLSQSQARPGLGWLTGLSWQIFEAQASISQAQAGAFRPSLSHYITTSSCIFIISHSILMV